MAVMAIKNKEAYEEFLSIAINLSPDQHAQFFNAVIAKDKDEWHIQGGPDLMTDPIGIGSTIREAVWDFFNLKHLYEICNRDEEAS